MCKEVRLSQNILIGAECVTPRQSNSPFKHLSLQAMVVIDQYSASADERDTVGCFLVFHEIEEFPKKNKISR